MDGGLQPGKRPCHLGMEEGWEHLLPCRYSWGSSCTPSSYCPCPNLLQATTTQAPLPLAEVPKRPGKANDQGQEAEVAKNKSKGKEVKLPLKAKGSKTTLKVKDSILKVKEADPKPKGVDPKPTNPPVSQPSNKVDPPPAKA